MRPSASVADDEITRFSEHAEDWWNPSGAFQPLHKLNPVRLAYVQDQISQHYDLNKKTRHPLQNLAILDVGCGGGLITEPLARLGATITGIDASAAAITEAKRHAKVTELSIHYKCTSAEDLAQESQRFDVITALEIAEHVEDMDSFVRALGRLLKPDGLLILSTLNRTIKSFFLGIVAAEYILNWVPRGTHNWQKFIRPSELVARLEKHRFHICDLTGLIFNPLTNEFILRHGDVDVNYLLTTKRVNE